MLFLSVCLLFIDSSVSVCIFFLLLGIASFFASFTQKDLKSVCSHNSYMKEFGKKCVLVVGHNLTRRPFGLQLNAQIAEHVEH